MDVPECVISTTETVLLFTIRRSRETRPGLKKQPACSKLVPACSKYWTREYAASIGTWLTKGIDFKMPS
eukprot:6177871-Pleurochrysis_carterae.AAC.1